MSDTEDASGTAAGTSGTVVNRRALLRASGVAAGIAGLGGLAAAQAPAADAAAGDPLVMGAINDAENQYTALQSSGNIPTMTLVNNGNGAPLRLEDTAQAIANSGDLVNVNGDLQLGNSHLAPGSVFTSYNTSRLVPFRPFRIVDTRTAAGRSNLVNPAQHLDSAGRLIGGHTIDINLARTGVAYRISAFVNLTVTQAVADGYLTLWPSGTRPGTSTLNYSAGQTVGNFAVSGLSLDRMRLYANTTTHVLIDLVAFVHRPSGVNNSVQATTGAATAARSTRKPPAWWTSQNG
ncbi:hypothetical protein [Jatrophihabitans sp.]|jgi:hypothetical protein|uniref:hypothetical protein n=1 Tax=Jatrophihabitans sp. TaxID=1932789 RepID=UPI002EF3215B